MLLCAQGPCEVWCDNTLVLRNDDCRSAFGKELPARMKIDAAQCAGAKQLQFMWLAVHFSKWQYWCTLSSLQSLFHRYERMSDFWYLTVQSTVCLLRLLLQCPLSRLLCLLRR